jgi:hypothetical protein
MLAQLAMMAGCGTWESMHSMTGLPWWATIPLTTFAMRSCLLPLTLKAKSAGLNFVLAQQATQTATNLLDHWKQQQAGSTGSADASTSGSSSSSSQRQQVVGLGRQEELKRPSRWRLTRMYYRYYRKQYGTTSLWWWTANVCLQVGGPHPPLDSPLLHHSPAHPSSPPPLQYPTSEPPAAYGNRHAAAGPQTPLPTCLSWTLLRAVAVQLSA